MLVPGPAGQDRVQGLLGLDPLTPSYNQPLLAMAAVRGLHPILAFPMGLQRAETPLSSPPPASGS